MKSLVIFWISLLAYSRIPLPPAMIVENNQIFMLEPNCTKRAPSAAEIVVMIDNLGEKHKTLLLEVFEIEDLSAVRNDLNSARPGTTVEIKFASSAPMEKLANFYNDSLLTGPVAKCISSIDREKLNSYMQARSACLKGNTDPDVLSMYEALAEILSDKRCTVSSVGVVQVQVTRSLRAESPLPEICKTINIPTNASGIGVGRIDIADAQGNKNKLIWDANHLTPMTQADWLNGHKNHQGFYSQLSSKHFCGENVQMDPASSGAILK